MAATLESDELGGGRHILLHPVCSALRGSRPGVQHLPATGGEDLEAGGTAGPPEGGEPRGLAQAESEREGVLCFRE